MARKVPTFSDGSQVRATKHEADIKNEARLKAEQTEKEKSAAKELQEERIQQIMSLMRQVATDKGVAIWTTPLRKSLAASWKITDVKMQVLSGLAHKRVIEEAKGKDSGTIERNFILGLDAGLLNTIGRKSWKEFAAIGELVRKTMEGPTKVEVTVQAKQPTAVDAAQAVKEMFGSRVTNEESESPAGESGEKPDDGTKASPSED